MKRKSGEPSFASRWSRLKQEAKAGPEAGEPSAEAAPEPEAAEDRPDEEVLAELGLPDPDTLKPGDDFKAFMAKAVPARLRARALRRLWVSNPVLANIDGLVDYGEDFTDAATVIENLQTAYQVGKGFVGKAAEASGEDAGEGLEPAVEPAAAAGQEPAPAEEISDGEAAADRARVDPAAGDAEAAENTSGDEGAGDDSTGRAEGIVQRGSAEHAVSERRIVAIRRMRFRVAED